jgi:predicted nucleic acid-binding protein
MNSQGTFVDSNILVYAYDKSEAHKQAIAEKIIEEFWKGPIFPSISTQVLMEFFVNIRPKVPEGQVSKIAVAYLRWNVVPNDAALFREAAHFYDKHQLSLWDCGILAAAKKAGSKFILSEDFQHNRSYEGIKIINPFI